MTNSFKYKHLLRGLWGVGTWAVLACGHKPEPEKIPITAPLPTAGLAGQLVIVLPFTLVAAEDSLHWEAPLADRHASLYHADSILGTLLQARAPEVTWVLPAELRRDAQRAPGIATNPDHMGTSILRGHGVTLVPDPLRGELRTLAALAGGGNLALVPAALVYRRAPPPRTDATAELALVLVEVRSGQVGWRTVATGNGNDPWIALTHAVKGLTPGLP